MTRTFVALGAVSLLIGWFWQRGEAVLSANGPTFDEPAHLATGLHYWQTKRLAMNPEHPPLLKLWWSVPLVIAGDAPDVSSCSDHWQAGDVLLRTGVSPPDVFRPARRMNLILGCGIVLVAGWWAFRGSNSRLAAVGAAAFASCDPNLLALSCVLTTDAGFAFFALLTAYLLWEYAEAPSHGLLLAAGTSLGLMLGTKLSAIAMAGGFGLAGAVHVLRGGVLKLPGRDGPHGRLAHDFAFRIGVIAVIALAATYGFVQFDEWGRGLKFQLTRGAHGDGRMFLNGELSKTGWLHYFIVAAGLKLPLSLLIASGVSLFALRRAPRAVFLLMPPAVFVAAASWSRVDLGVRVVLPATVFLYVIAAATLAACPCTAVGLCRKLASAVAIAGVVWSGFAAERAQPYPIAYFNELAAGRGLDHLADSNADWGQGLPTLKDYLEREKCGEVYLSFFGTDRPDAYGITAIMLPGYGQLGAGSVSDGLSVDSSLTRPALMVVSANNLIGLNLPDSNLYAFLRSRSPVAVLARSLFVFDITHDPEARDAIRRIAEAR
jgi:hypothetical protein